MSLSRNLGRLYDEHAQAFYGFALNLLRSEADARDVLQEVFLRVARQPELLDTVRDERGFLLRLTHNKAIDLMRRRETRERNYDEFAKGEEGVFARGADADETAFREQLSKALGELPPEQRAVAHLKLWEGLTFEGIGEALEIPANTAASRYRYALDKLRERLRPIYDEIK
jgi:RNA polymerase sigma-70 factor (ECF subfamily)